MAASQHSDTLLREMMAAVRSNGSIHAASVKLNIPYETMKSRVHEARKRFPHELPASGHKPGWAKKTAEQWQDCTGPEIESSDEDLDTIMDRLEEEDERKEK